MSDHVLDLLGAYLDGELQGGQLRRVTAHLQECQSCLEELQALQAISAALQEATTPEFSPPERLASDVALRLPRDQAGPSRSKALEYGWWLVPVGLLAAWVFLSTTLLVSRVVILAGDFGLLDSASAWLAAGSPSEGTYAALLGRMGMLANGDLQWLTISEGYARQLASTLFWQISISMLYLGWLAIWWARHAQQESGQLPGNGNAPTLK